MHRPRTGIPNTLRRARIVAWAASLLVAMLGAAPLRLAAQAVQPLGAGVVTAQVATGTVGTAVGFIAGGLITRRFARSHGADEFRAGDRAFAGALVGAALVTPVGPALLGNRNGAGGSYLAAQGGAVAGGLASALFIAVGRRGLFDCRACGLARIAAGVGIAFLPSVGATVAYNASRRR